VIAGCAIAMGDDKYLVFRFATEGGGKHKEFKIDTTYDSQITIHEIRDTKTSKNSLIDRYFGGFS
jgi:hypothetical protein